MSGLTRIALHGVPRSGTSWVGEILNSSPLTVYRYQPLFSYAFKGQLTPTSSAEDIDAFFDAIAKSNDDFLNQTEARSSGALPVFDKREPTHVVYKEVRYHHLLPRLLDQAADLKLVAVIRNPLSVIASWVSAPREFRHEQGWKLEFEWLDAPRKNQGRTEEFFGFRKWLEATLQFQQLKALHPDRVLLLEYDALVEETHRQTQRLFEFCHLQLTEPTEAFLRRSTQTEVSGPYSVFRSGGTRDRWRKVLPPEIAAVIARKTRDAGLGTYLRDKEGTIA